MIRILLADDHTRVRKGLRQILEECDEWQVCGEACDGREAVELALELKPDIAVLDLAMPQLDGLDATRQIKKALPQVEVLILTMHDTEEMILGALEAGARGFVLKSMDTLDLIEAIKAISRRQTFVSTAGVRNFPLRSSQQRK